jgi:hypothetical protein
LAPRAHVGFNCNAGANISYDVHMYVYTSEASRLPTYMHAYLPI